MEIFKITKIKNNVEQATDDYLAEEIPFTINIGEKELVTLLCSPIDLEDLVRGFLFTSGLINEAGDIQNIVINTEQWVAYVDLADNDVVNDMAFKRLYTSGCGKGTLFYSPADIINREKITSDIIIKSSEISTLMADFFKMSHIFLKTGGVHSAALAESAKIEIFREDIGRHNAIDKVIGHALKERRSFTNKILITSGRISSEVLLKAHKVRIPVILSRGAPTNQAVKHARDMSMTLLGFARLNRMNIYSVKERVAIG